MDAEQLSPRQKQAIKTRQKLLDAGLKVFLEQGFQKTTISQIIKEAKTGYGTAYVYFQNKDEIFIELMEHVMKTFYEVADLPFEPSTKEEAFQMIQRQVQLFLELGIKERQMMKVMKEAIGCSAVVEQKWIKIRDRFIQSITKDVQHVQEKGLAKPALNPTLVARTWFYANEMFMWELVEKENFTIDEIVYHLTSLYTGGLY
ncbi:TetR/AcrR family transcriptional regulator [Bacillus sp. FJAT-47783]|uniref:TetR/AcrR family transcriptional regulator n=1 Tax=Bacillus sp. FJAT-47783 TaxID=2922712 RepID=UPI001FACB77A|nr:TetR/AcrR family transcriptional regulator [Bacillus sp. FJAT-47783]